MLDYSVIRILGFMSTAIPIFIGLYVIRFLKPDQKAIFGLMSFALMFDVISLLLLVYLNKSTILVFHIYTLVEYLFFGIFYIINLKHYINTKLLILVNSLFFIFLFIVSFIISPSQVLDSFSMVIEYLMFIGFSILLIFKISFSEKPLVIDKSSILLNYTFLIYFSLSFVIFLFSNLFTLTVFKQVWEINSVITILMNLAITYALWKTRPQLNY